MLNVLVKLILLLYTITGKVDNVCNGHLKRNVLIFVIGIVYLFIYCEIDFGESDTDQK